MRSYLMPLQCLATLEQAKLQAAIYYAGQLLEQKIKMESSSLCPAPKNLILR